MQFSVLTILGFALLLNHTTVFAWDDLGHEAVGEIAERNLDARGKNLVLQILGGEPLAVAATFPDHVRNDERYHQTVKGADPSTHCDFHPYHFLDMATGKQPKDLTPEDREPQDAHVVISEFPKQIADPANSRDQKMIWLRYVVHVVGDVHQPLHVGDPADMGANLCDVKWIDPKTKSHRELNLHSVWDGRLFDYANLEFQKAYAKGGHEKWFGYRQLVESILEDKDLVKKAVAEVEKSGDDPITWYTESRALQPQVYPDAVPGLRPETRPYCKLKKGTAYPENGAYNKNSIPEINADYVAKALPIAKLQVVKAGLRVAKIINRLAASPSFKPTSTTSEQLVLSTQLKNTESRR